MEAGGPTLRSMPAEDTGGGSRGDDAAVPSTGMPQNHMISYSRSTSQGAVSTLETRYHPEGMAAPLDFDPIAEAQRQWSSRWPTAALAMAAATSIMRAQQIVLAAVDEVLREFDLTFARYEALVLLSFTRHGEMPLSKMGPRLMIHPTSVTNIVDRLEEAGLLSRMPHPTDRRVTLARITPEGRALAKRATQAVNKAHFGVQSLDERASTQLVEILSVLRVTAGDFEEPSD
jgi:DNA-binding MarR family transcriptional regulator